MFDDDDGSVRLNKTRSMNISYESSIGDLVKEICDAVPELKEESFELNIKKGKAKYTQIRAQKLLDHKVALELKVQQIYEGRYRVECHYRTKIFRPFFLLFVCLGLLFGLLPGAIIFLVFRESDTDEVEKVTPALDRLEVLIQIALQNTEKVRISEC